MGREGSWGLEGEKGLFVSQLHSVLALFRALVYSDSTSFCLFQVSCKVSMIVCSHFTVEEDEDPEAQGG